MAMREGCPPLSRRVRGYPVVSYPRPPLNLRLVAFHEAGHALLFAALGFRVKRAYATENEGLVEHYWPKAENARIENTGPNRHPPQAVQDAGCWMAAASFAGVQAEMLSLGIPFYGMIQLQDEDTRIAHQCLMDGFPSDRDRTAAAGYAQALARSALVHLWPAVEVVAETLVAEGEVCENAVLSALHQVEDVKEIGRFYALEAMFLGR